MSESGPGTTRPSSLFPFLRRRREKRRRDAEIVGLLWVWDRPVPMTRTFAEWAELHVLPLGVSVLSDRRGGS